MNHSIMLGSAALALAWVLPASTTSQSVVPGSGTTALGGGAETIDFEGLPAGTILGQVFGSGGSGPIAVSAANPSLPGQNAAVIFDSANPTGQDPDLGTPNEDFGGPGIGAGGEAAGPFPNAVPLGNVLIVAEDLVDDSPADGLVDDPDDADEEGSGYIFDFGAVGPVTVHSIEILDVEAEESDAVVHLLDGGLQEIATVILPHVGDNGAAIVPFGGGGVPGVRRMLVSLNGSGAIDNIVFTPPSCSPCIDVEVECTSPGSAGGPILVEGTVTNCGDTLLRNVSVLDDKLGLVISNIILAPGESAGFGGSYDPTVGPGECSTNTTMTRGAPPGFCGVGFVMDTDSSECCVPDEEEGEGCTPGYWKQPHHFDSWPDSYTPGMLFSDVFEDAFPGMTLLQVLEQGGGDLIALGRHTVAALLNSTSDGVDYGLSESEVVNKFNNAFPGGDYETLKNEFAGLNEQGCPLN